jgi:1,4-alpha-glucan branching enzyme
VEKADPYGRRFEHNPNTASIVWKDDYRWQDSEWMRNRANNNALDAPYSVYEIHLGSWRKKVKENRYLSYVELAEELVSYVKEMNFTHVEFMPIMEYPYDPSWGYQVTGYFAPTSRFGYPHEFKLLVDKLHENGIGVILDWVPSHFPEDEHALGYFDGSHLYEHPDKRKGYHQDWKSLIFNYGRNEVRSFLISNAIFWLDQFHADGLRVDAVASMLFLDYSREDGEWEPNVYGGKENLEAISFLKELNEEVYRCFPDVQTIAEESTAFPMVSKPTDLGGLGFGMKWMMGWMHDTLEYFKKDSLYRQYHQNDITFSLTYAFTENFMLPLSHDEVVYGKNSILGRMPGDEWQRFANLRLLYTYMFMHPGTKLVFMGGEFGQYEEWDFQESLDWNLLDYIPHQQTKLFFSQLNKVYKNTPALFSLSFSGEGFEWIDYDDSKNSVIAFLRKGKNSKDVVLVVCNFTPATLKNYKIGLSNKYIAKEFFNSDSVEFGGSGALNSELINTRKESCHGRPYTIELTIPPLAVTAFKLN